MTRTYVVEDDQTIRAYDCAPQGASGFRTYAEWEERTAAWSGNALVRHYNALAAGVGKPVVSKFMNRDAGRKRLWKLLEDLPVTSTVEAASTASLVDGTSKKAMVLRLVQGERGATLEELMTATGWQAHSVRGLLSTQRREYEITLRAREGSVKAYYAVSRSRDSSS